MKRRLRLAVIMLMNWRIRLGLLLLLSVTVATPALLAQRPAAVATLAPLPEDVVARVAAEGLATPEIASGRVLETLLEKMGIA